VLPSQPPSIARLDCKKKRFFLLREIRLKVSRRTNQQKIRLEVSSLGGQEYENTNGVRREQDGSHLIHFKGRFYRPVEPGDLKK